MPRQTRPWKEQMNRGSGRNYYTPEEKKEQTKLGDFEDEDEKSSNESNQGE